jgi:hypothetical protein
MSPASSADRENRIKPGRPPPAKGTLKDVEIRIIEDKEADENGGSAQKRLRSQISDQDDSNTP